MDRSRLDRDPKAAGVLLDAAMADLDGALRELRELARGIHPAVLSDRGLGSALEALAQRVPLPVEIAPVPYDRLPGPVEAGVYFLVAEALTNVTRYAHASHARILVTTDGDPVDVRVTDEGTGGADPGEGQRSPRPRRPRQGARRPARGRLDARPRHDGPRAHPRAPVASGDVLECSR